MTETPDFDQLAREFMNNATDHGNGSVFGHAVTLALAEQLRQVWNARGAADREAIADELPPQYQVVTTDAIRKVDR
jgi:hypothetical protein